MNYINTARYKKFFIIILVVTVFFSSIQIVLDYVNEKKLQYETSQVAKKANYSIFIEIEDRTLYLLQDGRCIKKYPIASGKPEWPSPVGYWKIINKGDWGEGFGGRWMGLNVPWGILILDTIKI